MKAKAKLLSIPTGTTQISSGVRDAPPSDQLDQEEEITIDDAMKSIANNSDSWAKVKERIRSRNLFTNEGVFEVCLPYFMEEVDRLKKDKMDSAKKAKMDSLEISKISRLRKRLGKLASFES
eukprot:CAMPEP_0203676734 /NCGR_PEP_ID=MMETSP0090-20130426/25578_1 /ASSEMBLY_ACC=CAM_ASM_001088 /TAXON_ID=426623 /ORGANISM="Chaetoceros affinis, Strain CCMP159" /LENGTH=121 /DNA_ID=CAMNT_0050543385 /DNA_START=34 /DNA_END=399 /DNA_ORIENTATION=+